jgi:hypothetical protein
MRQVFFEVENNIEINISHLADPIWKPPQLKHGILSIKKPLVKVALIVIPKVLVWMSSSFVTLPAV